MPCSRTDVYQRFLAVISLALGASTDTKWFSLILPIVSCSVVSMSCHLYSPQPSPSRRLTPPAPDAGRLDSSHGAAGEDYSVQGYRSAARRLAWKRCSARGDHGPSLRRGRPGCCLGRVRPVSRDETLLRFKPSLLLSLQLSCFLHVLISYTKLFHGIESDLAPSTRTAHAMLGGVRAAAARAGTKGCRRNSDDEPWFLFEYTYQDLW